MIHAASSWHSIDEWGVQGEVPAIQKEIRTPWEVDVSDETGARTYFWERAPHVLNTLDTADLSLLEEPAFYTSTGMTVTISFGQWMKLFAWDVPVFLNF